MAKKNDPKLLKQFVGSVIKNELIESTKEYQHFQEFDLQKPKSGVSLPDANPHICPECACQCTCSDQPCSCCNER